MNALELIFNLIGFLFAALLCFGTTLIQPSSVEITSDIPEHKI